MRGRVTAQFVCQSDILSHKQKADLEDGGHQKIEKPVSKCCIGHLKFLRCARIFHFVLFFKKKIMFLAVQS